MEITGGKKKKLFRVPLFNLLPILSNLFQILLNNAICLTAVGRHTSRLGITQSCSVERNSPLGCDLGALLSLLEEGKNLWIRLVHQIIKVLLEQTLFVDKGYRGSALQAIRNFTQICTRFFRKGILPSTLIQKASSYKPCCEWLEILSLLLVTSHFADH